MLETIAFDFCTRYLRYIGITYWSVEYLYKNSATRFRRNSSHIPTVTFRGDALAARRVLFRSQRQCFFYLDLIVYLVISCNDT